MKGYHVFGWRDWFDIAIRWRQYSEPMDVVYWLDRLDLPDDQVGDVLVYLSVGCLSACQSSVGD